MQETAFNLLEEPWIRVLCPNGDIKPVSLKDALLNAHMYIDLAGETPAQDVAVLRLLLAVLHTVFARVNVNGEESPLITPKRARGRWKKLWQMGALPEKPILDYLTQWHERFWLFHPEYPFYQVPGMEIGKFYASKKWNGEVLESGNKDSLFSPYAGTEKAKLTYDQAARWLLHMNGFDVAISGAPSAAVKETYGKLQSTGTGYLGKLGLITLLGRNLFETLMLNLVLLKDGEILWNQVGEEHPCWEADEPRSQPSVEIPVPDNAAELLTIQSRRLLLHRENGKVTGTYVLGGDFFLRENAFAEQMTMWKKISNTPKNSVPKWIPKQHDSSVQLWREFSSLVGDTSQDNTRQPGIVRWMAMLRDKHLYDGDLARFRITSMRYVQKDCVVKDSFSDSLSFHADLLTELGRKWQKYITAEIRSCEDAARQLGWLAAELEIAAGGEPKGAAEKAHQQFYFTVDMPFRAWLRDIDPQREEQENGRSILAWRSQAKGIARRQGEELVLQAGPAAYAGRMVKEKKGGKDVELHHSAPEAYRQFLFRLDRIYESK